MNGTRCCKIGSPTSRTRIVQWTLRTYRFWLNVPLKIFSCILSRDFLSNRYLGKSLARLCFVNRKSSKSEGKFPTFRSGNPHYPKETCREFSFFSLSSRKESSIHCFLPNRVIRVRLCQRLPERFAFNVLSFDSVPAPG